MTIPTQHDYIGCIFIAASLIGVMVDVKYPLTIAQLASITTSLERRLSDFLPVFGLKIVLVRHCFEHDKERGSLFSLLAILVRLKFLTTLLAFWAKFVHPQSPVALQLTPFGRRQYH
jgi:hypothetical protein